MQTVFAFRIGRLHVYKGRSLRPRKRLKWWNKMTNIIFLFSYLFIIHVFSIIYIYIYIYIISILFWASTTFLCKRAICQFEMWIQNLIHVSLHCLLAPWHTPPRKLLERHGACFCEFHIEEGRWGSEKDWNDGTKWLI